MVALGETIQMAQPSLGILLMVDWSPNFDLIYTFFK